MEDLTIIYITANELPDFFSQYQLTTLLDAVDGYPVISVSRRPMNLGTNLLDTEEKSYLNIYRQMLRAAKKATTPYVAVAEDDVLYSKDHFTFYRPPLDTFAYNQHRWALFTWGVPTYSIRNRKSNCSLIAPRLLMIEALEERFAKSNDWPPHYTGELGRKRIEEGLGVKVQKSIEVFSEIGIVQINHDNATEDRQRRHRKTLGQIKAYDIPHWGKAENLIAHYQ